MNRLRSYGSIYNLGHKVLDRLWDGRVYVQEKVDGSQFSFGTIDGELICRSKGREIPQDSPGMFLEAVETARSLAADGLLEPGWTYRGEYLQKNKHNAITYDRVPHGHIILFDIDAGHQHYIMPDLLSDIGKVLGLEVVPLLAIYDNSPVIYPKRNPVKPKFEELEKLLELDSILGKSKIEGIVLKNYGQYGPDKKVLMAKLVSEDFRELHAKEWGKANPSRSDFIYQLIEIHRTEARWNKAVQHLREEGVLQNAPQDIPTLMKEVSRDIFEEAGEEIKERLFKHFWKEISKGVVKGLPEWWKAKLIEEAME